jgi:hypothetical protein
MRAPVYQNATQIIFSIIYLALYSQAVSTVNPTGDIDVVELILYIFTFGFLCDEFTKFWKVGLYYIGFWNIFNLMLYALLTTSLVTRFIALSNPLGDEKRMAFNQLSYNFLGVPNSLPPLPYLNLIPNSVLRPHVLDASPPLPRQHSFLRRHACRPKSNDERIPHLLRAPHRHHNRFPPSLHRYGFCGLE